MKINTCNYKYEVQKFLKDGQDKKVDTFFLSFQAWLGCSLKTKASYKDFSIDDKRNCNIMSTSGAEAI